MLTVSLLWKMRIVVAVLAATGITAAAITLLLDDAPPDECEKTPVAVHYEQFEAPSWALPDNPTTLISDLLRDTSFCEARDCLVPLIDESVCLAKRLDVSLPGAEGVCRVQGLDNLPPLEASDVEKSSMLRTLELLHSSLPLREVRAEAVRLRNQLKLTAWEELVEEEEEEESPATSSRQDDCQPYPAAWPSRDVGCAGRRSAER